MAHLTFLKRRIKKIGGTIVDVSAGRYKRYHLEAPSNKRWAASSTHDLVLTWWKNDAEDREQAIVDAIERVGYGLEECDDPECGYCHPVDESEQP